LMKTVNLCQTRHRRTMKDYTGIFFFSGGENHSLFTCSSYQVCTGTI
jgi:hypothetical protein